MFDADSAAAVVESMALIAGAAAVETGSCSAYELDETDLAYCEIGSGASELDAGAASSTRLVL